MNLYLTLKAVSEREKHFSTKAAQKQDMTIIIQKQTKQINPEIHKHVKAKQIMQNKMNIYI